MLKNIILIFIAFNFQFCAQTNDKNEIVDYGVAATLLKLKECEKSISSFKELIVKYPNSKHIEDYFLSLDQSFECKKSKDNNTNPIESDIQKRDNGKGTVTITFLSSNSLASQIDSQRITFAEFYLSNYSNGKHRIYFEDLLLHTYPRKDNPKFLDLLERLRHSNDYDLKYYSNLFLATYQFAKGNYRDAISVYSELIPFCKKEGDKSIYQLYLSNCYYNLGEYDRAISELKHVYEIEMNFNEKYMSKMADRWMPFYIEMKENPNKIKKQLLFIN